MTTIERLGILGIRSYGTEKETFIRFGTPLTIILGRNGSGKSSIIESIRMAATGQLPPLVGSGAAFIHDPRIDSETETKAKIRLQFSNARGDQYVVSRHFVLSVKRTTRNSDKVKLEFKRLDQTLKLNSDKSKGVKSAATSYRCADLDALLPEIMRVSKPILNNVIFVHQEDSHWPLGKQDELKKRFDEIFASTRYTKALDTIRKFRKEKGQELRVLAKELELFEERVQNLDRLQAKTDELHEELAKLNSDSQVNKTEIEQLAKVREAAKKVLMNYEEKEREHEFEEQSLRELVKQKTRLLDEMDTHFADMDVYAMKEEYRTLKKRLDNVESDRLKRKSLISESEARRDELEKLLNIKNTKKGSVELRLMEHDNDRLELRGMKQKFLDRPGFATAFTEPLSLDAEGETWKRALEMMKRDVHDSFSKLKDECRKLAGEASSLANEAVTELQSAELEVSEKKRRRDKLDMDISQKRASIRRMGDTRMKFEEAKENEFNAKKRLDDRLAAGVIDELNKKLSDMKKESDELRNKLDLVWDLRNDLARDQNLRSEVDLARKNVSSKRSELRNLTEEFRDTIIAASREIDDAEQAVPGCPKKASAFDLDRLRNLDLNDTNRSNLSIARDDVRDACNSILERRSTLIDFLLEEVRKHLSKQDNARTRKDDLNRRLESSKQLLGRREMELGRVRDRLSTLPQADCVKNLDEELSKLFREGLVVSDRSGCNIASEEMKILEETLARFEKESTDTYQRVALAGSWPQFWKTLINRFENDPKNACPACGLSAKKKVDSMRRTMNAEYDKSNDPDEVQRLKREAETLKEASKVLKNLQHVGMSVTSASETFVPLDESMAQVNEEVSKCEDCYRNACSLEEQVKRRLGPDSASSKLEKMQGDFSRAEEELFKYERRLGEAESSMPCRLRDDDERTIEDVELETRELEGKKRTLESDRERTNTRRNREHESIASLRQMHSEAMERCAQQQKDGLAVERTEQEIKKMADETMNLEKELKDLQPTIKDLKAKMEDAVANRNRAVKEQEQKIDEATEKKGKVEQAIREFESLQRKVEIFISSGEKDQLPTLVQQIKETEEELNVIKGRIGKLHEEAQSVTSGESGIKDQMRNLKMNMECLDREKEIAAKKQKMQSIRDDVESIRASVDGGDPRAVVEVHSSKIARLRDKLVSMKAKHSLISEQYLDSKRKLEKEESKGGRKKYDECRITKQTMELASSDLEKYHRALDQALMAFHTLKMNSINRTIKELWQQTYRGTDIDEIEIASDAGDGAGAAPSGKRNYNYRVMMRQGNAQLDMRGRCSAGQKVLACLVIRLALADSFCTDCGLLALDEPTTNLDQENIESLASALKSIIELRKKQRNFQLVLITHDRDFIEMIGAREFAEEFFLIYKDAKGISNAKLKDLCDLPE